VQRQTACGIRLHQLRERGVVTGGSGMRFAVQDLRTMAEMLERNFAEECAAHPEEANALFGAMLALMRHLVRIADPGEPGATLESQRMAMIRAVKRLALETEEFFSACGLPLTQENREWLDMSRLDALAEQEGT
jgi:hypothetical protein